MRGLNGKTVIVTGGAGAIGGAICRRFAGYGAKVGVFDRNVEGAEKIAGEIKGFASAVDITDYKAVAAGIAAFENEAGPTDIIAFTKTVAREVARRGITLNTVCPGPTDTPLLAAAAGEGERGERMRAALVNAIPMKRVGQPDDIPGAVCFLASDDAAFITGQTISVSGGLTMHG